ncbi:hypothetical protein IEU95_15595 [Hoyosella rhizosphaerae]|uniref:Bacterial SCP orthologue domain-containing protein n=1 Tax=Hoyosella rhizosphaerae TaxID=1755582 RepID=A0A916UIP0_9ACTN|nr:sterol carrier family protein [Hoyosella rhizosphaerae]MBN4928258.1 hypothetical protein [Hoyosella rhizosphaerae]GGC73607.1 hypothetical protein GCM10011410_28450 [Hoyosella rhizosphaerae]
MPSHHKPPAVDPHELRSAVLSIADWIAAPDSTPKPPKSQLAAAVRLSAQTLASVAPGRSVELRIPPYVAVQCIAGTHHSRGTPPNVVEVSPAVWMRLVAGHMSFDEAIESGDVDASGIRAAAIGRWLPLVPL